MRNYLFCLLSIWVLSCSNKNCEIYEADYIPKNLTEALEYLDCKMPDEDKAVFAETDESEIIGIYHMSLGRFIRNDFSLWNADNELYTFFKNEDITNPETISSILITSFHRKLNHKDIAFETQVQEYHEWLEKVIKEKKEKDKKDLEYYESFKINDTVEFDFDVNFNGDKKMELLEYDYHEGRHCCPCKGKGTVAGKVGNDQFYGYEINIKLIDYCDYANLSKDGKIVKKGDTINYYIMRHNIHRKAN